MAAEGGRQSPSLIGALFQRPWRFGFFQAVRLLERARRKRKNKTAPSVGEDGAPGREAVRFRALPQLSFPAATVSEVDELEGDPQSTSADTPARMTVCFLGLTGPSGVLPQHYTEMLIRAVRGKDNSFRDFLDLFNHRTVSFFYRAGRKYRLPALYEGRRGGNDDPITRGLYALTGFGTDHLRRRLQFEEEALPHYAGHFAHMPRSAAALEALLSDYLERKVEVKQFQGRWLHLEEGERSMLPSPRCPGGQFCRLGENAVAGDRVWDVQGSFRLCIGPLEYEEFQAFMPGGGQLEKLTHMTRLFVGPEVSFDVQLILKKEEVPDCALEAAGDFVARLGWNTWAAEEERRHDVSDTILSLEN